VQAHFAGAVLTRQLAWLLISDTMNFTRRHVMYEQPFSKELHPRRNSNSNHYNHA